LEGGRKLVVAVDVVRVEVGGVSSSGSIRRGGVSLDRSSMGMWWRRSISSADSEALTDWRPRARCQFVIFARQRVMPRQRRHDERVEFLDGLILGGETWGQWMGLSAGVVD